MERHRAGPQLVQPDPHQAQRVRVEDIEVVASVHQDLREPRVPDDWVDHQRVLTRVGDAVRVILTAERDGVLRPVEEGGRRLLCGEDLVPLPLALAAGHVDGRPPPPPKMRKTFSMAGKPSASPSPPSFLASPSFTTARL
jgi:hypothetical protein